MFVSEALTGAAGSSGYATPSTLITTKEWLSTAPECLNFKQNRVTSN